jgi:hypothetical protein
VDKEEELRKGYEPRHKVRGVVEEEVPALLDCVSQRNR